MPLIETPHLAMPKLGLGTWALRGAECARAVVEAIGLGYRHIDTAEMYGNEEAVGQGVRDAGLPREQLFVTTKVWWENLAAPDRALEASLSRLGLDYVDLFLIHWPNPAVPLAPTLAMMEVLKERGLARAIGVANFTPRLLREAIATGAPLAANQVEYHVMLGQEPLLALCRAHGIALTAYSPLGKGGLTDDPVLARIGAKHGVTGAQVALAWLTGQEMVAAIPKSGRAENMRANLASLSLTLDDEDRAAIAALPKDRRFVNPAFAPNWND
ncbi:MAG: aldo/keto reductase [Acetobacteraceae bacterium]|jgi:2,5-diketo-D-gluconate reductase B|nr:aldo/keto reductase [Acetobacteraceae bacterium]